MYKKTTRMLAECGLTAGSLDQMALDSGFIKRFRKLHAIDYIHALVACAGNVTISYARLAVSLSIKDTADVSRQALHKAMSGRRFVLFLLSVLHHLLAAKSELPASVSRFGFRRIIVQDSTIIKLPSRLMGLYSGVRNGSGCRANARIQFAFDLLSDTITLLRLNSYSVNDLKAADRLPFRSGDLVLRDRGYFSLSQIRCMLAAGAHFVLRYKHSFLYFDPETGEQLDLLSILRRDGAIDRTVLISENGPPVRIAAMPIPEEMANNRRAKLKKEAKHPPQAELLALLSWSIFITSLPAEKASFDDLLNLYGLRWRVENIFKAMKGNLNLDSIHNVSQQQLKFILLAKAIVFLLVYQVIYRRLRPVVMKKYKRHLSLPKLCQVLAANIQMLCSYVVKCIKKQLRINSKEERWIKRHCCYDRRRIRVNFNQQLNQFA